MPEFEMGLLDEGMLNLMSYFKITFSILLEILNTNLNSKFIANFR